MLSLHSAWKMKVKISVVKINHNKSHISLIAAITTGVYYNYEYNH